VSQMETKLEPQIQSNSTSQTPNQSTQVRRMTVYLANAFSPSMLNKLPSVVEFQRVDQKEFCEAIHNGVSNAIGHKGTIELVNTLCNTNLQANRVEIKAGTNDVIYIIVLGFRLEEGRVLSAGEIQKAYDEGKVLLLKAVIK